MGCCQTGAGALPTEPHSHNTAKRRERLELALILQKIYRAPVLNLHENSLYLKRKRQIPAKLLYLTQSTTPTDVSVPDIEFIPSQTHCFEPCG